MSIAEADATSVNLRPGEDLLEVYRRTGAAEDFERVVTRYAPLVYGECRRVTRDAHDAEDAAQLAFLALAIELRTGGEIKRPAGWLQRVAKRQALKIVRSRGRRRRREDAVRRDEMLPPDPISIDPGARDATASLIREAIDALPEKHRLPLVLHYFGGMSLDGIARELGMTRTAVGTRLHRARKLLGQRLEERGLVFDAGELSAMVGLLVPATVIASLHRGASSASTGAMVAASPATFATSLGHMLVVAGNVTSTRPIAAATAVLLCIATSSGLAWFGPTSLGNKLHLRPVNLQPLLTRLLNFRPSLSFLDDDGAVDASDQAELGGSLGLPTLVDASRPRDPWEIDAARHPDALTQALSLRGVATAQPLPMPQPSVLRPRPVPSASATPATTVERVATPPPLIAKESSVAPATAWAAAFGSTRAAKVPTPPASTETDAPRALDATVGSPDQPTLAICPGDHVDFGTLTVDRASGGGGGGGGAVTQRGGQVSAGHLVVGNRGNGRYDLIDGRIDARKVTLGAQAGSHGLLHLGGGELRLTDTAGELTVGDHGDGTLLMGSNIAPGRITSSGAPIVVRGHDNARGTVEGWGNVDSRGTLTNNGKVIADGRGKSRTLDLSKITTIDNTIENKPSETNGWFVRHGGKLVLPAIHIAPGTGTYTWGESAHDTTIDLVNSIRFTASGQTAPGRVLISLQSTSASDHYSVNLPTGVSVIGLWSFASTDFDPSLLSFQVRYDHIALGSTDANLLAFRGNTWQVASDLSVDSGDHLVSGTFGGSVQYLAIGSYVSPFAFTTPAAAARLQATLPLTQFVSTPPTISPEPATLGALLMAASVLTRRRRRTIASANT